MKIVVLAVEIAPLTESTYSMYLGQDSPEYVFAVIFLRAYILLLIVTVISARFLIKRFGQVPSISTEENTLERKTFASPGYYY